MHNVFLVARREYLEQIRGRAFRLSTVLVPVLFAVVIGIVLLTGRGSGQGKHVIVAAPSVAVAETVRSQIMADKDAKMTIDVFAPAAPADRPTLVSKVRDKSVDGLLWVGPDDSSGVPTANYVSRSSGDIVVTGRLSDALDHAVAVQRLTAHGMSDGEANTLLKTVKIDTRQLDRSGREVKSSGFGSYIKGYVMALLLSMTTMIYGMNVARSVIQEKTSRIFEVMLAIARPSDMLAGKLIGVGAVGLTQIAIWVVFGAIVAAYPAAMMTLSGTLSIQVSWVEAVLFPVYFVLGFLLYASLFAGLASTCETEQELQMYTPLAALPVWLAFSLIWLVINDPGSALSVAASLFPATAPIIMMLRLGSQQPPAWQFALSISIMVASIWVVLWFSSRIYRVGILMYGKRATLPELLRWIRYS